MKKALLLVFAMLVLVMSLAGCSTEQAQQPQGEQEEQKRTDVVMAINSAINEFDPVNWYLGTQSQIFQNVYSTLIDIVVSDDQEVTLRPNLAKTWETEEDGKVWVFHLNPNAVYSNGDAVTAQRVKSCFERHLTNPYTMSYVSMVESFEVRDDHTFVIRLKSPWSSAPYCWYMVAIFHPELYDADKESYIKNPVGSGPYTLFKIDEVARSYELTLKENWWGDVKPAVQTVIIKTITDLNTMMVALETGEIDFAPTVTGTYVDLLKSNPDITLKEGVSNVGWQVIINYGKSPLNNNKLRQAIGYALNYDALDRATTGGYISSKSTTVKFGTLDYHVPDELVKYYYNPDKAKQLIAETGLPTPIDVGTIIGGTSNGSAEIVQRCLDEVGIKAEIVQTESNAMAQALMSGDFDLGITTSPGYVSAGETLLGLYGTGQPFNFSHFSNERVDELINIAISTQDREQYEASVTEALEIIIDECPALGIGIPASYSAGNSKLYFTPIWSGLDLMVAHW